ncbi:MAG: ferrous iron transport protein A, partial [Leptospira sp.]|nr:ferrous iron transport protein A [Leptospira sp.]
QGVLGSGFVNDLLDFGFFPGTRLEVIHKFSNQSKMTVGIGPAEIALRITDAKHILVACKRT